MPRRPAPLPPSIDPAAFTVDDARRAGVTWSRLQSSDLRRLRHGIYGPAGPAAVSVREWTMDEVRAYQRRHPGVVVSHETAARLHGLTVPARLLAPGAVHVSVGTSGGRPVQAGLVPHRIEVPEGQRMTGSSDIRWGSWGESAGGEEHAEPVVVAVAEAAGEAAVQLNDPVHGLSAAVR